MNNKLKIVTINCKSLRRSSKFIEELCSNNDVVALQETWLLPTDLHTLQNIHDSCDAIGTSAVDTSAGPLVGRPHGGIAILYKKTLKATASILCETPRLAAIELTLSSENKLLIINIYMPTCKQDNFTEFVDCLSKIHAIKEESNCSDCLVIGDFNADSSTQFGRELLSFCTEYNYECVDRTMLPADTYTFVSDAHGSVSWLDHCLISETVKKSITDICVDYDVTWTDHRPIHITLSINKLSRVSVGPENSHTNPWAWRPRDRNDIVRYGNLMNIYLPHEKHREEPKTAAEINELYELIVTTMQIAAAGAFNKNKKRNKKYKSQAGWSEHVAEHYAKSRDALREWHCGGRPAAGELTDNRRLARSKFKEALKKCQQNEEQNKMNSIAKNFYNKNFTNFWQKTNKICKSRSSIPSNIDGETDKKRIADLFINKFTHPPPATQTYAQSLQTASAGSDITCERDQPGGDTANSITPKLLQKIMSKTANGKSPGHDGLSIEHLKTLGRPLCVILCNLFRAIIKLEHLPISLTRTVVVPICKDKQKDISNSNNYRPIALAPIIARLLEKVIHSLSEKYLYSSDHQMGFKSNSSTTTAIYVVKQIAHYYKHRNTSVIACYLDLSKAFDRVSHTLLWDKLRERGMPEILVRVLVKWHQQQTNSVRWNGEYSKPEKLYCGVRQGGSSSPVMFNVYMDELSSRLAESGVGCYMDGLCVNHASYADDMVLLAPSVSAMRLMLKICEDYAESHNMLYNASKSVYMVFESSNTPAENPPLHLNGAALAKVSQVKYLGHLIDDKLRDEADIERQRRAISVKANMLARRFQRCSVEVKRLLFTTFCYNLYTAELWCHYTKAAYNRIRVQYNNAWRILHRLPPWCSASEMFAAGRVHGWAALMRHTTAGAAERLRRSCNTVVRAAGSWQASPVHEVWRRLQTHSP